MGETLKTLLMIAWLLPLLGFAVGILGGYWGKRQSKTAALISVGCIAVGFLCSAGALIHWGQQTEWVVLAEEDHHGDSHNTAGDHSTPDHDRGDGKVHGDGHSHSDDGDGHAAEGDAEHQDAEQADLEAAHLNSGQVAANDLTDSQYKLTTAPIQDAHDESGETELTFSGTIYTLAVFGDLELSIDYYIDSLTLVMFTMVTLIATCIHIFAIGYMSDELTDEYVDHHAHTADGHHVHRPGRFYRFFAFLSLFCFSMLGLVLAGNIFQVFVFWELVGICSYLLIGFYTERKTASNAANKAFIMNRVGDFGFLIGLMVIWTYFGTFRFGDVVSPPETDSNVVSAGLFSIMEGTRGDDGDVEVDQFGDVQLSQSSQPAIPYYLLVVAGMGVFAGCIGKSAQFPLQTWLPDAMEGPTPVSALVHSATMVAAGVYLVGRFYPMFVQEVLLTIAYIGCITLFLAATIAIVATDIKQVLAYSTISQLGYMMLGLGVFGWGAGLFHLITHAFFKSLMFLCSGSVIHGCHHEQEMPKMGGLWRKMPITAFTMLVGVIAISGLAIPGIIAFSGFHSKDAIVATALAFTNDNPVHFLLFLMPLITAGITAFYMFRLWFYTFTGKPRDQHLYDHCHESPWVMTIPLLILSVFAAFCAVGGEGGFLYQMIGGSEPSHIAAGIAGDRTGITLPGHDAVHAVHGTAGTLALLAAVSGTLLAWILYGTRLVNVGEIKRQLSGIHGFLANKWCFDELYDALCVAPAHVIGRMCAWFDRVVIDGFLHGLSRCTVLVSKWDRMFDELVVDGFVNMTATGIFSFGRSLRAVQTGRLRQYVMFILVGVVALFFVLFATFPR